MKKLGLGILITLTVLVLSGIVVAQGPIPRYPAEITPDTDAVAIVNVPGQAIGRSRVMVPTTLSFSVPQECTIIHKLNDALALECPKGIQIRGAFEDEIYHIMDMEADQRIRADQVWTMTPSITGDGVTVAVLDTGIDSSHQELSDSYLDGFDFFYNDLIPEDDNGHGTHVSGIITANGVVPMAKGVAPDAKIWMGKVCGPINSDYGCYVSDIAAAIEYAVKGKDGVIGSGDEPAKIISISIGGGGTGGPNCNRDYLASKVNWAVSNGVTVVVAAGNNPSLVSSPACASEAIAVGAVDKSDVRAWFSGTGKALDIMAPGVNIYSTLPGNSYDSWDGTSMATPHVAATVALMRQKNPSITDSEIKDALYKTAKDLGAAGWDKYYGWGRVDAYGAVTYSGVTPPPSGCVLNGSLCNCNGVCNPKESLATCPSDCP